MPDIAIWSDADFGTSGFAPLLFGGTFTVGGPASVASFSDDDPNFEDSPIDDPTQVVDIADNQLLTSDLFIDGVLVGSVGERIYNAAEATVFNETTGETGRILFVTIEGGTGADFVGFASTIPLRLGDTFTTSDFSIEGTEPDGSIICFGRGTLILTDRGYRPVEDLEIGDLVETRADGLQSIRWIGSKTVAAAGDLAPIVFAKGAIGNDRELVLSPQHRIALSDWKAELYFGEQDVLVAAKNFLSSDSVFQRVGGKVEYFHILFDAHQVIYANDVPCESFHPGAQGLGSLNQDALRELLTIFPELGVSPDSYGAGAHRSLKAFEARLAV